MIEKTTTSGISNGIKLAVTDLLTDNVKSNKDNMQVKNGNCEKVTVYNRQIYVTMFASELLGTGLLMFLGCMGCISNFDEPKTTHHFSSLGFGLVIMLIIQTFGHISGAHLNPAVTIATVIFGTVKPFMAIVYVIAQFAGATLGYGLLKVLATDKYVPQGFCATTILDDITTIQALAIETIISTVLILICCAVWDKRNETKVDSIPLRFGLAITAISIAAGPLTGASMNTARSFAPLVFGGNWSGHWIYWVGPNIGALFGCAIYKFLFSVQEDEDVIQENIYLGEIPREGEGKP